MNNQLLQCLRCRKIKDKDMEQMNSGEAMNGKQRLNGLEGMEDNERSRKERTDRVSVNA